MAFDGDNPVGAPVPGLEGNRIVALNLGTGSVCTPQPVDYGNGGTLPEVYFPGLGDNYDTAANSSWPGDNTFNCGYEAPSWNCDYQYSCA